MNRLAGRVAGRAGHGPTRLLWVLVAVVALLLVVGAVAGAVRDPAALDPGSPEGVTQAYLQDVFDRDFAAARQHLSEESAQACSTADFRLAWVPESLTAVLDEVRLRDGEADVAVRIRTVSGPGPFGGGDYSSYEVFTLVRPDDSGDAWRISGDPWPLFDCGQRGLR